MKQKINFLNPRTGKREIGCRDLKTDRVHNAKGVNWSLKYLQSKDPNGIGYFETAENGIILQKVGIFKRKKK